MTSEDKLFGGIGLIVILGLLLVWLMPVAMVDTGEVGIVSQFGNAAKTLGPGMHFKMPVYESVTTMNTRVQNIEMDCSAASSDLQSMTASISINYRIDSTPDKVLNLYRTLGKDYEVNVLNPIVQSSVKAGTAEFTSFVLLNNRVAAEQKIGEMLNKKLDGQGFIITQVNLVNVDFSDEFDNAIEESQQKKQEVLKEEQELRLIEIQGKQTIVRAEAEANATRTEARAEAEAMKLKQSALTSNMIKDRWIAKWDGKLPETMLGDSEVLMTFGQ